jgi:hypothetical protein
MKISLLLLLVFSLYSLQVSAQDFFAFLMPNAPTTSIEIEGAFQPEKEVSKKQGNSDVIKTGLGINQKAYDDGKNMVTVAAKVQELDLDQNNEFLRDYYNHQVSLGFRRTLPDNKFWFTSVSYGSASDKPFKNSRDSTIGINHIQKFSQRWYGAFNYSNNRSFLNNVPLPGFFYVKEMSRDKIFIVGLPFLFWLKPISQSFSISYLGVVPWTHRLKLIYTSLGSIRPYLSFEQSPQSYFRHDRDSRYDRFYWFERRLAMGIEGDYNRNLRYDFSGGYAFDREFSEGRNFSEKSNISARLENSYFLAFSLRVNL